MDGREPGLALKPLFEHGYAKLDGDRLRLTVLGFLMSNEVLTYLLPGRVAQGAVTSVPARDGPVPFLSGATFHYTSPGRARSSGG